MVKKQGGSSLTFFQSLRVQKSLFPNSQQEEEEEEEEVKRGPLLDLSATATGKKKSIFYFFLGDLGTYNGQLSIVGE